MDVWRPWDADEDEYAELLAVREMIPEPIAPAVRHWLFARLHHGYSATSAEAVNLLQSSLRVNFGFAAGRVSTEDLLDEIYRRGEKFVVRVTDLLLHARKPALYTYEEPPEVSELRLHLDLGASSVTVVTDEDGSYRIARRLPEGVEELAAAAAQNATERAGFHLTRAWTEARAINPDTSKVMAESIKAVEAAAGPVVTRNDRMPRLGKIVNTLRDQSGWGLVFERRDDGHPDLLQVLIGMLETLAFAQRDRHSGAPATSTQAIGHVQLASTLVSWFSTGVVVRDV